MFSTKIKVNFFHADPAGIIFFSNIYNFAHSAYEEMVATGNLERDYFYNDEYGIPIIHSQADYFKPVFPGSEIIAEITVDNLKESSFELVYNFKNDSDEILAIVKTVHVFVSKYSWDKTKIPFEFNDLLLKHYVPAEK